MVLFSFLWIYNSVSLTQHLKIPSLYAFLLRNFIISAFSVSSMLLPWLQFFASVITVVLLQVLRWLQFLFLMLFSPFLSLAICLHHLFILFWWTLFLLVDFHQWQIFPLLLFSVIFSGCMLLKWFFALLKWFFLYQFFNLWWFCFPQHHWSKSFPWSWEVGKKINATSSTVHCGIDLGLLLVAGF